MKRYLLPTALVIALLGFNSCKDNTEKQVLTKEVKFKKEGTLNLKKSSNDSVITQLEIEIAEDEYEIQTGLMYRKSMLDNRGMLFIFEDVRPRAFYMKNTDFGLDIIFLDADMTVLNIHKNAVPGDQSSLPSDGPTKYVLEVNAGFSDRWNLEPGDRMEFSRD